MILQASSFKGTGWWYRLMGGQRVIAHKMGAYIKGGTHSNHNIGVLIIQGDNGHITDCHVSRALVNTRMYRKAPAQTLSTELRSPNPGSHVSLRTSGRGFIIPPLWDVMDWLQCKCDETEIRQFGNPKINSRPLGAVSATRITPRICQVTGQ